MGSLLKGTTDCNERAQSFKKEVPDETIRWTQFTFKHSYFAAALKEGVLHYRPAGNFLLDRIRGPGV